MKLVILAVLVSLALCTTAGYNKNSACTDEKDMRTWFGGIEQCLGEKCLNYGNMIAQITDTGDFIKVEQIDESYNDGGTVKTRRAAKISINYKKECGAGNNQECYDSDCFNIVTKNKNGDADVPIESDSTLSEYFWVYDIEEIRSACTEDVSKVEYSCNFSVEYQLKDLVDKDKDKNIIPLVVGKVDFKAVLTVTLDVSNISGSIEVVSSTTPNQQLVAQNMGEFIPAKMTVKGESSDFQLGDDVVLLFQVDADTFDKEFVKDQTIVEYITLDQENNEISRNILDSGNVFTDIIKEDGKPDVLELTLKFNRLGKFNFDVIAPVQPKTSRRRVLQKVEVAKASVPITVSEPKQAESTSKSNTLIYILAAVSVVFGASIVFLVLQNRRLRATQKAQKYTSYADSEKNEEQA